jgi:hypothetical protein
MLDDNHGHPFLPELTDELHHLLDLRRVEAGHDLVEKKKLGPGGKGLAELQALLVFQGEVGDSGVLL